MVIKYGGNAMADDALRAAFAQDLVFLRYAGLRPVVVHGGGPQITAQLDRLGIPDHVPRRAAGHHAGSHGRGPDGPRPARSTEDIVGLINRHGPFAVGMSGEDAATLTAIRQRGRRGRRAG